MALENYYVNDNAQVGSGDHEVHTLGCYWLSIASSTTYLGPFYSCGPAVTAARRIYTQVNGCYFCCNPCHTG